jgi:hypothetical protein
MLRVSELFYLLLRHPVQPVQQIFDLESRQLIEPIDLKNKYDGVPRLPSLKG